MKAIILFFHIFSLLLLVPSAAWGQCCSAGNPVGGDGSQDGLKKSELRVFAAYRLSYSRDYYHLSSKEEIQHIDKSYYNYSSLSMSYGVDWRFTVHTEMGYFFNKVQVVNLSGGSEAIEASGLGDLSLTMRYSLLPVKIVNENQLIFSAGGRLPIGAFNEEMDGVVIPVSLQPSSGALKINSGLFFSHKKQDARFGWSSFAFFEWSNDIEKDFLVYKYGNFYMLEVSGFYSKKSNFVASLAARLEERQRDQRENNTKIESTGGTVVYLKPQLQFSIFKTWRLLGFVEVPVYKYVNGYQLTNLFAFQVGLQKTIIL
jgi:hypothetical protein